MEQKPHTHTRKKLAQPSLHRRLTTGASWRVTQEAPAKALPLQAYIQVIGWQRGGSVFAPLLWVYCGFTFSCGVPFHIPFSFSLFVNGIKKKRKEKCDNFLAADNFFAPATALHRICSFMVGMCVCVCARTCLHSIGVRYALCVYFSFEGFSPFLTGSRCS